jgi:hypothetical protein
MSRITTENSNGTEHRKNTGGIRRTSIIAVAAAVLAASGLGVYAAVNYLTPSEVASELHYPELAEQFEIQTSLTEEGSTETGTGTAVSAAAVITEPISVTSGDYIFTFLGITSGEDLSGQFDEAEDGSTYTVVTIENADGTPFDKDSYYSDMTAEGFFVSPLIHGVAPWMGGAAVFKTGGYSENIIDGKIYRITNCDNIEIFADTGVSLAVSTGRLLDMKAFDYNAETGLTTPNPDFDGAAAVFEIPFDPALGDPVKAAEYWAEFESGMTADVPMPERPAEIAEMEFIRDNVDWTDVTVVEGSAKILTPDAEGFVTYEYKISDDGAGGRSKFLLDAYGFEVGVPQVHGSSYSEKDGEIKNLHAIRYTLNEDGTLTAEIIIPNVIPEINR